MREGAWGAHQPWLSLGSVISFDTLADGEAEISAIRVGDGQVMGTVVTLASQSQPTNYICYYGDVWFRLVWFEERVSLCSTET